MKEVAAMIAADCRSRTSADHIKVGASRSEKIDRKHFVSTVERPDLVDTAAFWIWNEFWKKNGSSLAEIRALVESSDAIVGPSQCVLLLVDDVPVGTAGLIKSDLDSRPELTPWLAAMYVRPESRGRGYALELIRAVERAAVTASYDHVWLYTLTAEGLYLKAGWKSVESFDYEGKQAILMRCELGPPTNAI